MTRHRRKRRARERAERRAARRYLRITATWGEMIVLYEDRP
ncbi:MAG TPA: hypothetical protein VFG83_14660 [Kofleriaceae bacterium]|nr:hypothetical protein [Kofleriaceae bacterium]